MKLLNLDRGGKWWYTERRRLHGPLGYPGRNMAVRRLRVGNVRASSREYVQIQGLHCRICHRNVRSPDWNDRTGAGHGTRRTRGKAFKRKVTQVKYVDDTRHRDRQFQ